MPRNASGVYTLPLGNPVVTNTLIASTWANSTMSDIGSEITSSLDRNGRGSMLAPLKSVDGVAALPGLTFGNEPSMGLWRKATAVMAVSIAGLEVGNWQSTGWNGNVVGNVTGTVTGHASLDLALTGGAMTGQITSSFVGNALLVSAANVGGGEAITVINSDAANAASHARFVASVGGAAAGDPYILFDITGGTQWSIGADNSDSDRFKISNNGTLGAGDVFIVDTSGAIGIGGAPATIAAAKLQVSATDDARIILNSLAANASSGGAMLLYRNSIYLGRVGVSANQLGDSSVDIIYDAVANARWYSGGSELARLSAAGNFGVGIGAAPTYRIQARASGANAVISADSSDASGGMVYIQANSSIDTRAGTLSNLPFLLMSNGTERLRITAAGLILDANGLELGFQGIPRVASSGGAPGTRNNRGYCFALSAGLTIPNAIFNAGDAISIYNDTAGALTITQGASMTLRLGGTTTTGNRTLAARGFATVWFNSTSESVIQGSGVT